MTHRSLGRQTTEENMAAPHYYKAEPLFSVLQYEDNQKEVNWVVLPEDEKECYK